MNQCVHVGVLLLLLLHLLACLQTFFGLPAQRPPTPSGGDTSQGQGSQMEGGSHKDSTHNKEATRMWVLAAGPTQQQVCRQGCGV